MKQIQLHTGFNMKFKSSNGVFNRLDDEKKINILTVSIRAFSDNGFKSANINTIAEQAGVSVGAMYKYFQNKRALYLTCLEWSLMHLNKKIASAINEKVDLLTIIETIIEIIQSIKLKTNNLTSYTTRWQPKAMRNLPC